MNADSTEHDNGASSDVVWHAGQVTRADRARLLGQRGATVWITGLPSSGKSTLAFALEASLVRAGCAAYVLDGDNVRHGLCANLGFSKADRSENIRRVGEVALLMADAGLIVLAAFVSPSREDRDRVRSRHAASGLPFVEVYMETSVEICAVRDPKGLYRRARAGEIAEFTGVSAAYEPPPDPELRLDGGRLPVDGCVEAVLAALRARGIVIPG